MNQRINQEDATEGRPNLRSDDGTIFVYSRNAGVYEPYKQSDEQRDAANTNVRKFKRRKFSEHWHKHWTVYVPLIVNIFTLVVLAVYTYFAAQQVCAALKQVKISNDTMNLDERAWVSVFEVTQEDRVGPRGAKIVFENTGKTPATGFSVDIGASDTLQSKEQSLPGKSIVAPGGKFHTLVGADPDYTPSEPLIVHGKVYYTSVFGHPHWVKFCFVKNSSGSGFSSCDTGNTIDGNEP